MAKYSNSGSKSDGAMSDTKYTSLQGSKCLSTKHMPMPQGRMSTAKGTNSCDPTKGLYNASGRIGAGTRCFSSKKAK